MHNGRNIDLSKLNRENGIFSKMFTKRQHTPGAEGMWVCLLFLLSVGVIPLEGKHESLMSFLDCSL